MRAFERPNDNPLAGWTALVRRRWRASTVVFALVFGLAAALVLTARPIYRAEAKLRIGEPPPSPGVSSGAASIFGFMRMGGDPFANDLELLSSRTVAEALVRDAALSATVIAPRGWHRDSLFAAFVTRDSTITATYSAQWLAADRIEVRRLSPRSVSGTEPEAAEKNPVVGTYQAGAAASFGGLDVVFRARKRNGPERIKITTLPFGEAVRRVGSRVVPTRTRRDANVVRVVFTDPDPGIARTVTESAVARFVELRTHIQQRESSQNIDSLRAVARETQAELTQSEAQLEALQRQHRLVDPSIQSEAFITRYTELGAGLEVTRSHLRAIESVLARADSTSTPGERWSKLLSYPAFRENEAVGQMLAQLNALEQQRRQLASRRTEQNLEFKLVLDQINYMDRALSSLAADLRTTLSDEITQHEALLVQMDSSLASMPRQGIELVRRQRATRVLSEVLVMTEARLRQEELRQALSFANVQVIDPPALRYKPIWPRKKLGLAVGWMLASLCALLTLVVTDRADRRVRRATQVTRITQAPVLGVAVRTRDGLRFSTQELGAVVQHASVNGRGPLRIVIAPVGNMRSNDLVGVLRQALLAPVPSLDEIPTSRSHALAVSNSSAEVLQSNNLVDFASASAAAASEVPIALVLEAGRTTADDLERATELVRQAGGRIGGTIVVCDNARRAEEVWE
ncbi:MAG: GumC family protein [Longimicrobiales bacterium]